MQSNHTNILHNKPQGFSKQKMSFMQYHQLSYSNISWYMLKDLYLT